MNIDELWTKYADFKTLDISGYMSKEAFGEAIKEAISASANEGWHSVEDELPEKGIDCLVYGDELKMYDVNRNGLKRYYVARFFGGLTGWSMPGVCGLPITHWMPLPAKPAVL